MYRLEARLKSGSEWFATLREYKTERAMDIALDTLRSNRENKFEYRPEKGQETDS